MNARHVGLLLIACLGIASAPAASQDLGRLFLTPEERATLDARRKARTPDTPPPPPAVKLPSTRVDGYVERSGGRSTLWVNGVAIPEGRQADGLRPIAPRARQGTVTIVDEEGARRFYLKVGQSLDRDEGKVRDVIDGGRINVQRPEPPRSR